MAALLRHSTFDTYGAALDDPAVVRLLPAGERRRMRRRRRAVTDLLDEDGRTASHQSPVTSH